MTYKKPGCQAAGCQNMSSPEQPVPGLYIGHLIKVLHGVLEVLTVQPEVQKMNPRCVRQKLL